MHLATWNSNSQALERWGGFHYSKNSRNLVSNQMERFGQRENGKKKTSFESPKFAIPFFQTGLLPYFASVDFHFGGGGEKGVKSDKSHSCFAWFDCKMLFHFTTVGQTLSIHLSLSLRARTLTKPLWLIRSIPSNKCVHILVLTVLYQSTDLYLYSLAQK